MLEKLGAISSRRSLACPKLLGRPLPSRTSFLEREPVDNRSMIGAMSLLSSLPVFRSGTQVTRSSSSAAHKTHNRTPSDAEVFSHVSMSPNQPLLDATPNPPLLLEGDEFYVSHDGVARTYYELESWSSDDRSTSPVSLEEFFDLKGARKTFIVRSREHSPKDPASIDHSHDVLETNAQGVARLGVPLSAFEIQEIDRGVFGSAGTGSTTWESSIAMSLFFSSNPYLLRGHVVELGSGVGLAGLLSQISPSSLCDMESLTLTDGNREVLEQCQRNMDRAHSSQIPTHVEHLDWNDCMDERKSSATFDTVLASDCAYLYPDVVALSQAMALLCRDAQSRIHVFGPYNRGALHELVIRLRDELNMNVTLDWIVMRRGRLKPVQGLTHSSFQDLASIHHYCRTQNECSFASRKKAKFLHITAWHKDSSDRDKKSVKPSLADID